MFKNWHSATKARPCPICNHPDWCIASDDGEVAICYRVDSPRLAKSGTGWVHRLVGGDHRAPRDSWRPPHCGRPISPQTPSVDIAAYFAAIPTTGASDQAELCAEMGAKLGLPKEILMVNDWRHDVGANSVAIPMRDAQDVVIGIRYRSLLDGRKWSKKDSKNGLFYDPEFVPYGADELLVCEGPTDTAAAQACGFWCVGRPSCSAGVDLIREFVRTRNIRRVTIMADDDKPKKLPNGKTYEPGRDGAKTLGKLLNVTYRIVMPPPGCKDLRDWYRRGTLNGTTLYQAAQGNRWHAPGEEAQ